jgi:hypothetical protein
MTAGNAPVNGASPIGTDVIRQVVGQREYASGHPAMQKLNPTVYELLLQYAR